MSRWNGKLGQRGYLLLGAVLVAGLITAGMVSVRTLRSPQLTGTSLGPHDTAPGFQLHDSSGKLYSLSQYRGKVVVLTFMYTHCPDVCPLTAELLRQADGLAGHPANVEYLAVSVDPAGDTAQSVADFIAEHRLNELGDRWHYLVGGPEELGPVWTDYYIRNPQPDPPGVPVDHASAIYLIDKHGNRRLLLHVDTPAEVIARDERGLGAR